MTAPETPLPQFEDLEFIDESPVRCFYPEAAAAMIAEIESAKADRDTLGGVVEVLVYGLPAGIGSHVHWDRRLDARLAHALMSIQAIKGVELGDGFESARRRGSEAHDEIFYEDGFVRHTTRAGGTEGGMSIGGLLRVRAAMKPISTVLKGLQTVDINTKEAEKAFYERSDTCAVPAAGVVAEQMVAIVVAQECQRMFGGDTVEDFPAWVRGLPGSVRAVLSAPVVDRNDGIRQERRGPGAGSPPPSFSSTPICSSRRPPVALSSSYLKRRGRQHSGCASRM